MLLEAVEIAAAALGRGGGRGSKQEAVRRQEYHQTPFCSLKNFTMLNHSTLSFSRSGLSLANIIE